MRTLAALLAVVALGACTPSPKQPETDAVAACRDALSTLRAWGDHRATVSDVQHAYEDAYHRALVVMDRDRHDEVALQVVQAADALRHGQQVGDAMHALQRICD